MAVSPISAYMLDGQLSLKTNHPYLYQVMSPIKLEICVYTATSYWLVKVSTCGNTIYIYRLYIFTEMEQIMQDANSKGIPYISV